MILFNIKNEVGVLPKLRIGLCKLYNNLYNQNYQKIYNKPIKLNQILMIL